MITAIYKIGKAIAGDQEPIDCLLENIKVVMEKKDKKGNVTQIKNYILKIVFDLINNKIIISPDNLTPYDDRSIKKFFFCGNVKGKGKQFYLTRTLKSSHFLFGKTFPDLLDKMKSEEKEYEKNLLFQLVSEIVGSPMYDRDNNTINADRIEGVKNEYRKLNVPQLISKFVQMGSDENIVLVTPKVIYEDNKNYIEKDLVQMREYRDIVVSKLSLKVSGAVNTRNMYCYLCKKTEACSSSNLKKIKIMKLFTTTAINSASEIDKKNYDKNYRICSACLEKLLAAESFLKDRMQLRIAGTPTFLIPNVFGFEEEFSPKYLEKLHSKIEMAFREEKIKNFFEDIEDENENFSLNFLSYETDGKFFKVLNHIHDVPKFYFVRLTNAIAENYLLYEKEVKGTSGKDFSLGSIYPLIPVKCKKDGSFADKKNKALQFYSHLLGGNKIEKDIVFSYFCEAMYHLYMNQRDVYKNIRFYKEEHFDFAIKDYFYRYLILIKTLEDLKLIDKEEEIMEKEQKGKSSGDIENFLTENNFNDRQRALFYLGILINRVGYSQSKKGYKTKPILKKINYQGMTIDDVKRLYVDVFEKLVQHEALYPGVENINTLCKYYFDKSDNSWELSEFANIFYLLSGYAYKTAHMTEKSGAEDEVTTESHEIKGE